MHLAITSPEDLASVNSVIDDFFDQSIAAAQKMDPSYERLWRSLQSLMASGGKRLRPQMTILAYRAFGCENVNLIAPVAAAQEFLHFSLLIHDDIIDRDYIRYGVDNIAGQYKRIYFEHLKPSDDPTHYAHSAAILGGDLMLSAAHQLITTSQLSGESIVSAQNILSRGIFEVAGGELLDTESSFVPYEKGGALKVATYKTASYSFVAPLLTGAVIAGNLNDQRHKSLESYATALGIAYQLADDIIGVFGDEEKTGKSTVGDIVEGKRTYLTELAFDSFSEDEKSVFMTAFGNPNASTAQIDTAKQLLESCGARQKTEQKMNEYADTARASLAELGLPNEYHEQFLYMINKVTNRNY